MTKVHTGTLVFMIGALVGCSGDSPIGLEPENGEENGEQNTHETWPVQNWTVGSDPVFAPSGSGWDSLYVGSPTVIEFEGMLQLWYHGGTTNLDRRPEEWDDGMVFYPRVLTDGDGPHIRNHLGTPWRPGHGPGVGR